MTTTNATVRQPSGNELDFASPTQFRFQIQKLPEVQFFCQTINIPGISVGNLLQPTPLNQIAIAGSDITYEDLTATFLIDEQYRNYREVHDWLKGLSFPENHTQFQNLLSEGSDRMPRSQSRGVQTESGKTYPATPDAAIYSDATLSILTSKNNPQLEVRFRDVFPKSISSVQLTTQDTEVNYLVADVTFGYKYYDFATI
jgi:hypothetical protein